MKKKIGISVFIFTLLLVGIIIVSREGKNSNRDKNYAKDQNYSRDHNPRLGLKEFYGLENFYAEIFQHDNGDCNHKNIDSVKVDPLAEPHFGWKTDGKPVPNPTKVAVDGLYAIFNKDIPLAKAHAQWLKEHSVMNGEALFFPFRFDFEPYYPYILKAPWNSSLTQGVALGLFRGCLKSIWQKKS